MALKLLTPPATEPLTLAETKSYLKITDVGDDVLISQMITAVRKSCEHWTSRALVTQIWGLWLRCISADGNAIVFRTTGILNCRWTLPTKCNV